MKLTAFAVAATLALSAVGYVAMFASPAYSQDAPVCIDFYDEVFPRLAASPEVTSGQVSIAEVPAELLPKLEEAIAAPAGSVTRAFIFAGPGGAVAGVEVDGCLLPPIQLTSPILPSRNSGRMPNGKTYA